jgi:hypothetical protein
VTSMRKKRAAKTLPLGPVPILVTISGYAMKARPGPP